MGDDAAAAARRIVAEVLDRHAGEEGPPAPPAEQDGPPAPPAEEDEPTVALPSPTQDQPAHGHEPEPVPTETATDAARIARRIVEEVLASGPPAGSEPSDAEAAGVEASVRGVPPEGLSVEDEQTVHIQVPEAPVPPADAPESAAEIVRRIVADVQTGERPAEPASQDPTKPRDEATVTLDPSEASDEEEPGEEPVSDAPVGEPVGLAAAGAAAPAAGPAARPLVGWAEPAPVDPEPAPPPVEDTSSSRTLRWLLASLLGAVALAVLFPLAVAALRALVALD